MRSQLMTRLNQLLVMLILKSPDQGKPPLLCELPWFLDDKVMLHIQPSKVFPSMVTFFAILNSIKPLGPLPVLVWLERGPVVGLPPFCTHTCSVELKLIMIVL